jgi:hypothetical protein
MVATAAVQAPAHPLPRTLLVQCPADVRQQARVGGFRPCTTWCACRMRRLCLRLPAGAPERGLLGVMPERAGSRARERNTWSGAERRAAGRCTHPLPSTRAGRALGCCGGRSAWRPRNPSRASPPRPRLRCRGSMRRAPQWPSCAGCTRAPWPPTSASCPRRPMCHPSRRADARLAGPPPAARRLRPGP